MTNRIEEQLLETSVAFATSRRAFELAIRKARESGWTDDQITRVTGLSRYQLADAVTHLRAA
ncbi:MAG TPA: hypothetical protein VHL51_03100 [Gaiellales bacterium]|jgi:hypothetical protein|nr:hypothetical protein [Gaiellales bacterium]